MELIIAIIGIAVLLGVKINGKASKVNYTARMSAYQKYVSEYRTLVSVGFPSYTIMEYSLRNYIFVNEISYDKVLEILHNDLVYIFGDNYRQLLASNFTFGGKNTKECKLRSDRFLMHLLLSIGGYIYEEATGSGLPIVINGQFHERCCQVIERHLMDFYPNHDMNMTYWSGSKGLVFICTTPYDSQRSWSIKPYDSFYSPELRHSVREHIQSALADPSVQNGTYGLRI